MWWWWGTGTGTPAVGTPADNAPSLWSGGIRWGDPAAPFADQTDGYWGAVSAASGRTGFPRLSVAIGGELVLEELRAADWKLGRDDWLSTLTPGSASFDFTDVPVATVNDTIVVGLMSDETEYHSDALWVGRVDSISTTRDLDGHYFTTISATDIIGILGLAQGPATIDSGHTLVTLVEELAEEAGLPLEVDTDPTVTLPSLLPAGSEDEPLTSTVLDLINRAERSSNALLFLRGSGRLYAAVRDQTGATSVRVILLDGDSSPSDWSTTTSLQNVITRWQLGAGDLWSTDTEATTLDTWGEHTYSATDLLIDDPEPYADLIASDVMANPRPVMTGASFPITDLAQPMLYVDPLDRVTLDGDTWQVMSVSHRVTPIRDEDGKTRTEWRVGISADATQEALVGADDPGPVTPPGVNQTTFTVTASKGAWVRRNMSTGAEASSGSADDLIVGRYDNVVVYRSLIEFDIPWPANTLRVVSASLRLKPGFTTGSDPRCRVYYTTESWSEGSVSWPGAGKADTDSRAFDVNPDASEVAVSITAIVERWRATGVNNGVQFRSVNEATTSRSTSFLSDDVSPSSDRPRLVITVEVIS